MQTRFQVLYCISELQFDGMARGCVSRENTSMALNGFELVGGPGNYNVLR